MAWRTAGKLGCGGGPLIRFFAPPGRGDGVAGRRRRSWSSARDDEGPARIARLKVIQPELLFQLLMRLSQIHRALMVGANVRRSVAAGRLAR